MICKHIQQRYEKCGKRQTHTTESTNYEATFYECDSCSDRKQILIRRKDNGNKSIKG